MIVLPDTIKMVITDFDGIITDNCVYIDSKGETTRKLNFKDIMAFSLLKCPSDTGCSSVLLRALPVWK